MLSLDLVILNYLWMVDSVMHCELVIAVVIVFPNFFLLFFAQKLLFAGCIVAGSLLL